MPTIAVIDGVRIVMWPKDHLPPHLHAIYAESEAQISIRTGDVLKGKLPAAKLRAVQAWLAANRPEVAYMWRDIVERNGKGRRIDR
jgi:microcystin-dependent protein